MRRMMHEWKPLCCSQDQDSQPSRSRSAASQSTDGTYLSFSENSLISSLPLSSQCTKSEITYYLHCINGFPNSHVMKKLL